MSKELSAFKHFSAFDGVYTAQKGTSRCVAFRLKSAQLCLYSPVQGLGTAALESLSALGEVTHLLAPNHYHHKGLKEYLEAFPQATICCSQAAKPRIQKQTGLSLTSLEEANLSLPKTMRLLEPEGLKTGEVWAELQVANKTLWVVSDAFRGPKTANGAIADHPELLGTFPSFGIAQKALYFEWLSHQAAEASPTAIIPCHGSIISSATLGPDALKLVSDLL